MTSVTHVPYSALLYNEDIPVDPTSNIFFTHSNYARPYQVTICNYTVRVIDTKTQLEIAAVQSHTTWLGESPITDRTMFSGGHGNRFLGNSILIELNNNIRHNYMFIGHVVFTFIANSKIIKYVSEVGNNDVPYPYAIDENNNFYLMIEDVMLQVPYKYKHDPYMYYYSVNKNKYQDIVDIKELIAGDNSVKTTYNLSFHINPQKQYNYPWMQNLHAIKLSDNSVYPISEDNYVTIMQRIADAFGYNKMNLHIIHSN